MMNPSLKVSPGDCGLGNHVSWLIECRWGYLYEQRHRVEGGVRDVGCFSFACHKRMGLEGCDLRLDLQN